MGRPTRIRASNWPIGGSDWPVGGSRTVNRRYWRTGGTSSIHGEDTLISRGPGSARDQIKPRSSGASFEKRVNLASSRAEISRRG